MKPAVVIGQESGFDALKNIEIPEIQTLLDQLPKNQLPRTRLQLLLDSYADFDLSKKLSQAAFLKLESLTQILERNQALSNIFNQQQLQPTTAADLKVKVLAFLQSHQLLAKISD